MKQCEICGKTTGQISGKHGKYGRNLCGTHRQQMDRCGGILSRTIRDPNEFIVSGDTVEIVMYNKESDEVGRALVDTVKYDIINGYKWCINAKGYVITTDGTRQIALHRLVTNAPQGMQVDHRNHNKRDNRIDNLRICTNKENQRNQGINKRNTSGYTGVYWDKTKDKWKAFITVDSKGISLGSYSDINDAIEARRKAVEKYFGEFAYNPGSGVSYATQSQPLVNRGEQC